MHTQILHSASLPLQFPTARYDKKSNIDEKNGPFANPSRRAFVRLKRDPPRTTPVICDGIWREILPAILHTPHSSYLRDSPQILHSPIQIESRPEFRREFIDRPGWTNSGSARVTIDMRIARKLEIRRSFESSCRRSVRRQRGNEATEKRD